MIQKDCNISLVNIFSTCIDAVSIQFQVSYIIRMCYVKY